MLIAAAIRARLGHRMVMCDSVQFEHNQIEPANPYIPSTLESPKQRHRIVAAGVTRLYSQ